jgi:hypothetical protein
MRGSIEDLAAALVREGLTSDNVLLGDWREDTALLSSSEQKALSQAMVVHQRPNEGVDSILKCNTAVFTMAYHIGDLPPWDHATAISPLRIAI